MPTFKVFVNERKINKRGEAPIYLRIIKDRKSSYISLGYYISPEDWDDVKCRVKKSHPNSTRMNNYIAEKLANTQSHTLDLETKATGVNTKTMKKAVVGEASPSFLRYADKFLKAYEHRTKPGTFYKVRAMIEKIKEYMGVSDLLFDDMTVTWLKGYESYLRNTQKNKTNTVHGNFKVIRNIVREAINEELLPYEKNPFLRFKLKTEPTNIEYLNETELASIAALSLKTGSIMDIHRDMYVFATYVGGIRISDLLQMRWINFDGERINLHTQKTGTPISVKIPGIALEILKKYKSKTTNEEDFIFPIFKNDTDYTDPKFLHRSISSATAYTNKDLNAIATKAKINKHIHFHTSRHTFVTRALRKGMKFENASKLVGHTNLKTTQIYAKIVNEELDKAMEVFNN